MTLSLIAGYAGYLPARGARPRRGDRRRDGRRARRQPEHRAVDRGGRLLGYAFGDVLVFLLNAGLFVLVGLQLPGIVEAQDRSAGALVGLGAPAGAVVIGTRLLRVHTTPHVVRAPDRRPQQVARRVGWRTRTVMGWAGLRGAVSPAAALALPQDFPERELLVWLTLCVIFATLVLQGLTLPLVIRTLGVREDDAAALEALRARKAAARAVLDRIEALRDEGWARDDSLDRLRGMYEFRHRRVAQRAGALDGEEEHLDERSLVYQRTVRDLLETQRREIVRLRNEEQVSDEVLHALTREVDLEGQRLEI